MGGHSITEACRQVAGTVLKISRVTWRLLPGPGRKQKTDRCTVRASGRRAAGMVLAAAASTPGPQQRNAIADRVTTRDTAADQRVSPSVTLSTIAFAAGAPGVEAAAEEEPPAARRPLARTVHLSVFCFRPAPGSSRR